MANVKDRITIYNHAPHGGESFVNKNTFKNAINEDSALSVLCVRKQPATATVHETSATSDHRSLPILNKSQRRLCIKKANCFRLSLEPVTKRRKDQGRLDGPGLSLLEKNGLQPIRTHHKEL